MDLAFQLDMFNDAYKAAVTALEAGNTAVAKKLFLRAADIMDDVAKNSAPPLDKSRRERAAKLRSIAESVENADNGAQTQKRSGESGEAPSGFLHISKPSDGISFDDIVGLEEAKKAIRRLLINPLKNPDAYKKYGLKAGGLILLEGPPGTGKTTFAKAAACEISVPFCEVDSNSLIDSYIGKTGKNIDAMFEEARALSKKNGTPVVLFIDEIDCLAQKRGGENKTAAEAVPTLIRQTDGFSATSDDLVIIAATNIKESLDPAILSRFRNVIHIPLPAKAERKTLFERKLRALEKSDMDSIDLSAAAERTEGFSGRDINSVALDLLDACASRDAGIGDMPMTVGELALEIIEQKKRSM